MIGTYERVHRLVCSFARFETVIHFVGPWAHLNSANKIGVDNCFSIQAW